MLSNGRALHSGTLDTTGRIEGGRASNRYHWRDRGRRLCIFFTLRQIHVARLERVRPLLVPPRILTTCHLLTPPETLPQPLPLTDLTQHIRSTSKGNSLSQPRPLDKLDTKWPLYTGLLRACPHLDSITTFNSY